MKIKFLFLFILFSILLNAQDLTESFYEHYTGLISEELKITADLIKTKNSFSGFYYYEFEENGSWISSNPIALDGRVNEDGSFVLNEFGGQTSYFQGQLENSKLIKGVWVNDNLKEDIEFTLKATYPNGSIPLNLVEQYEKTYFNNNSELPSANLSLVLLFPNYQMDQAVYHQMLKKIYYYAGYRGEISDKSNIISKITEKYNSQFQRALNNIETDSFPDSFDWQKSIRIDVINNESGLVCFQFDTYAKSGSRDGSLVRKFMVFDLNQNQVLKLSDVVKDEDFTLLSQIVEQKLRIRYKLDSNQALSEFGFFNDTIMPTENFYLHPGGIGFYYNVYEIAPFSNGSTDLFISWQDLIKKIPINEKISSSFKL